MASITKLMLVFLWLPQAVGQLLNWLYWVQVKEYRFDRFSVFLKSETGKRKLNIFAIWLKAILLVSSLYFNSLFYLFLFWVLVLDCEVIRRIWQKRQRRPVFTQRAKRVFLTSIAFIFLAFLGSLFSDISAQRLFLFGEMYLILSLLIGVLWTIPIVNRVRRKEIDKAKRRLFQVKPLVIGITGSYGKGTTKDFLTHLLSQKFKVAKTEGSENTVFGIARRAQKIKKGTEFFMVEMGAYKQNEIRRLVEIVNPGVGIITGIEEQHLSLFGKFENIKNTKFELIESLPKNGVAIFNLSNKYCQELAQRARKLSKNLTVLGYSLVNVSKTRRKIGKNKRVSVVDMKARIIKESIDGIDFEVSDSKETKRLFAPLAGAHFIENLCGAILLARYFGVSWAQIEKACKTTRTPKGTMWVLKSKKAVIIDDSFNNTPAGFKAALSYLNLYKKRKKVVITSGIIELGNQSFEIHKKLGEKMSDSIDKIILTNRDFLESIGEGVGFTKRHKLSLEEDGKILKEKVISLIENDFVILLEGRMPAVLTKYLDSLKGKD